MTPMTPMTMTKTKTLMRTTLALAALTLAASCKKEAPAPASAADTTAPGNAAPGAPKGDPEKGDFGLEKATAGLAGQGTLMARITTPKGELHCELFFDVAPKTVASFV